MIINVDIEGADIVAREMQIIRSKAFTSSSMRRIFRKAVAPMRAQAKKNATQIRNKDNSRYQDRAAFRKAIGIKPNKVRSSSTVLLGVIKKKLPTIGSDGKPYKAFGGTGVPVALWQELGTDDRGRTGRIKASWPIYKAFKQTQKKTIYLTEDLMTQRLIDFGRGRLRKLEIRKRSF